jgi:hypothetical protein
MAAARAVRDHAEEAVRARIAQRLAVAGVPRVEVEKGAADAGESGHGGFAIHTGYGGVKLYLPDDVLCAYTRDQCARRTVDEAITGILELLRRP